MRLLRQLRERRGWSWTDLARGLRDTARQLAVTSLMNRQVASIQRTVARWESLTSRTSPGDRYQFLLAHLYARTPSGDLALGTGSISLRCSTHSAISERHPNASDSSLS